MYTFPVEGIVTEASGYLGQVGDRYSGRVFYFSDSADGVFRSGSLGNLRGTMIWNFPYPPGYDGVFESSALLEVIGGRVTRFEYSIMTDLSLYIYGTDHFDLSRYDTWPYPYLRGTYAFGAMRVDDSSPTVLALLSACLGLACFRRRR